MVFRSLLLLALGVMIGCQPSIQTVPPEDNPTFGPHGGPLVSLPDGQGMVEIDLESVSNGFRLVAYFYSSAELNSPFTLSLTNVRVELREPGGGSIEADLSPEPKPGESKYVSGVGEFETDPLIGTIYANIGGQPSSLFFSGGIR